MPTNHHPHLHSHHPRKSLRDHLQHALPPYTGPHPVGFLELELPAREPRAFSPHIKRNDEYALKLDTVLFAVYYPATPPHLHLKSESSAAGANPHPQGLKPNDGSYSGGSSSSSSSSSSPARARHPRHSSRTKKRAAAPLSRPPWLPRPRGSTCKGYAKFFSVPRVPVTVYMAVTSMFTKLPAYRNARLARGWVGREEEEEEEEEGEDDEKEDCGFGGGGRGQHSGETLVQGSGDGDGDGEPPGGGEGGGVRGGGEGKDDPPPRFPVVIFSHGLGGSRTLYSTICGELASFGLVVVAMEHRDGSGARTFVNKAGKAEDLESQGVAKTSGPPKNEKTAPERRKKAEMKPHYKIDYLFPKGNAKDTSPQNPEGVDKELRAAQIEMRLAEVEEAFYVLGLVNSGKGDRVRRDNLRKGDNIGSSSVGLDGVDWGDWIGRLDLESVTMMGHSFGGATTVQGLRSDRLTWITQGILLDPWGPATPECTEQRSAHKPVLSVGSEAFMHWTENFDCIEQVCHEARASGTLSWMTTIRGSTHLSQTDFAVLYPNWMSLLIKTIVDPDRAIYLTVHSALEFLTMTLPQTQTRLVRTWPDGQLLRNARSETKVVSDHRPDDKWVAARLKIPNEFSTRLRSTLGRASKGSTNQGAEAEIWCHQSPDRGSVERYMRRNHRLPVSTSPEGVIA